MAHHACINMLPAIRLRGWPAGYRQRAFRPSQTGATAPPAPAEHNQAADAETRRMDMGVDGGAVDKGGHDGFSLAGAISTNLA